MQQTLKKAEAVAEKAEAEELVAMQKVETPNTRTIEEVSEFLNVSPKKTVKTLIYNVDGKLVGVLVRGDREVNEVKVANAANASGDIELASHEEVMRATNAETGFAGPVGLRVDLLLVDEEVSNMYNMVVGANETGYHLTGVNYGREFEGVVGDFRNVENGEACPRCGKEVAIEEELK